MSLSQVNKNMKGTGAGQLRLCLNSYAVVIFIVVIVIVVIVVVVDLSSLLSLSSFHFPAHRLTLHPDSPR